MIKLKQQTVWRGTHKGVPFKVINWGFDSSSINDKWNYYLYLLERNCVDFEKLWLPGTIVQISESSPTCVIYDYYPAFSSVEMHGGITYYEKQGELVHRAVEIGCDFAHLHDEYAGWCLESVVADMQVAIDSLYEKGYLKPLKSE